MEALRSSFKAIRSLKSLFDTSSNNELIQRIEKLTRNSLPLWGKMTVNQMIEHADLHLKMTTGEIKVSRSFTGKIFGLLVKKIILNKDNALSKSLPTHEKLIPVGNPDLDLLKKNLINSVSKFSRIGANNIGKDSQHYFFGKLSDKDWDILMWKHLDHHLKQFGV